IADFAQPLAERGPKPGGGAAAEPADHRHRLLLRADQERISRRTGENRHDELPASHPHRLNPTLGMEYGFTGPLPKDLNEWRLSTRNGHSTPRAANSV